MALFVGLDLSNHHLRVAAAPAAESQATIAINEVSNRTTPCALALDNHLRLAGEAADVRPDAVRGGPAALGTLDAEAAAHTSCSVLPQAGAGLDNATDVAVCARQLLLSLIEKSLLFGVSEADRRRDADGGEPAAQKEDHGADSNNHEATRPSAMCIALPAPWAACAAELAAAPAALAHALDSAAAESGACEHCEETDPSHRDVSRVRAALKSLGDGESVTVVDGTRALAAAYLQRMRSGAVDGTAYSHDHRQQVGIYGDGARARRHSFAARHDCQAGDGVRRSSACLHPY